MRKWINYSGTPQSTCPRHLLDKTVEVRFRYGIELTGKSARTAQLFTWEHTGRSGDIVAYRIVEDAP